MMAFQGVFVALCLILGTSLARNVDVSQEKVVFAEGPRCPIEDPLVRAGPIPINVTLHPLTGFNEGSEARDISIVGLSTLKYNFSINIFLLTMEFEVDLGQVDLSAEYSASGYVDARPFRQETVPSGNFTGQGHAEASFRNLHFKGIASVIVNLIGNKVQLRSLNLQEVSFDSASLNLGEEWVIGGETIDWPVYNANLKSNFDRDLAEHKEAITEKIRDAANIYIGQYTLAELIDLIENGNGGDCDSKKLFYFKA